MSRRVIIIVLIVIVALAGYWGYTNYAQAPDSSAQVTPTPEAELENVIWASGRLVPETWAAVSAEWGGRIEAIHVEAGDRVEAGDVLVELKDESLQRQVEQAEAALNEAQANLEQVTAGAKPEQVESAEADVEAARANLRQAEAQKLQAEEAVAAAQAQLSRVREGPDESAIIAARAEMLNAEATLKQARAAYDQVKWRDDVGALPQSEALRQATVAYEAAKAQYENLQNQPKATDVAAALADVRQAQANVESANAAIEAAQAQIERAQAGVSLVQSGATDEEIAMAEARVESAQAALEAARTELEKATIEAPFAGTVGKVQVRAGELAQPGQPLLMLGKIDNMHVETTDLRETDVTRVDVGMPVEVNFDALPDTTFEGRITSIEPMSSVEQGSTNYTVDVAVENLDPRLRWGMTAFVNIQAD